MASKPDCWQWHLVIVQLSGVNQGG